MQAESPGQRGAREKLGELGAAALSDAELVALLLGTGTSGEPVSVLAERVLCAIGGARALARTGVGQLANLRGVGLARRQARGRDRARRRVAARPLERARRSAAARDVVPRVWPLLASQQQEEIWAIALASVSGCSRGGSSREGAEPPARLSMADVFRQLIREGAAATILVHIIMGVATPARRISQFTERRAGGRAGSDI